MISTIGPLIGRGNRDSQGLEWIGLDWIAGIGGGFEADCVEIR